MERVDGRTRRAGGGRGGSRRAGTPGPLDRAPGGGPGTRRAPVARRRDQRDDRGPARRPGRAGAALALGVALAVPGDLLAAPVAARPVWTLARLAAEIRARTGETVSPGHLSVVLREGATAGVGRGTPSRGGSPARSTARGCA